MDIATLAIILRNNNREVLLGLKRKGSKLGEDKWNGPGGIQELGETILECLMREVEEEVGIILLAERVEKVAIITCYYIAAGIPVPYMEIHVYRTNFFIGTPYATKSMIPTWYDAGDPPFGEMHESDCKWFDRAIKGEKFRANAYHREKAKGFINIVFFPFVDFD